MRSHDVALKLFEFVGGDADIGEQSDSGVHSVNGLVAGCEAVDDGSRFAHSLVGSFGDVDVFAANGNCVDLLDGERRTRQCDHRDHRRIRRRQRRSCPRGLARPSEARRQPIPKTRSSHIVADAPMRIDRVAGRDGSERMTLLPAWATGLWADESSWPLRLAKQQVATGRARMVLLPECATGLVR